MLLRQRSAPLEDAGQFHAFHTLNDRRVKCLPRQSETD